MTPRIPSPFTFLFESALLALTAALCVVLCIGSPSVAYADESDILAALDRGEQYIDVKDMGWTAKSGKFNQAIMDEIRNYEGVNPCLSHPTSYSRLQDGKGTISRIVASYDCPEKKVPARTEKYWAKVNKIAKKAQKKGSKYEQALYCYKTLIKSVEYDQKTADTIGRDQARYTKHASAASALVDGSSICVGYSTALRDLFRAIGLQATTVETMTHAWTQVELDGHTMTCDATKDDLGGNQVATDYFMVKSNGELYRPATPKKAEKKSDPSPAKESAEIPVLEEVEREDGVEPEQEAKAPEPDEDPGVDPAPFALSVPQPASSEPQKSLIPQTKQLVVDRYDYRRFIKMLPPASQTIYGQLSGLQVSPRHLEITVEFHYFTETL